MFCAKCGIKVSGSSKFCQKCGGNVAEKSSPEKEKKLRHRVPVYAMVIFGILIILFLIFYFAGISNFNAQYKHPILGFTFDYPKTLILETPPTPDYPCPNNPCFIVLKNPSYHNEVVNWIMISTVSSMGKDKTDMQANLDKDVSRGWATALTVNGIKMNEYINDPKKPTNSFITIGKMVGLDPSQEKSMYTFFIGNTGAMVFFKTPPTGAPADYNTYLDIQSWKNPTIIK